MQALCDIQISNEKVHVEIKENRDVLRVYIDDAEQSASQKLCKFLVKHVNFMNSLWFELI